MMHMAVDIQKDDAEVKEKVLTQYQKIENMKTFIFLLCVCIYTYIYVNTQIHTYVIYVRYI